MLKFCPKAKTFVKKPFISTPIPLLELEIDKRLHIAGLHLANEENHAREQQHIHQQVALGEICHHSALPRLWKPVAHETKHHQHKHPHIACDALHSHFGVELGEHLREHIHHALHISVAEHHEGEQHKHKGAQHRKEALHALTAIVAVVVQDIHPESAVHHLRQAKERAPYHEIPTRTMP